MRAVEQLMAAGVPGRDIQLVKPEYLRPQEQTRVGTFDDEDALDEREGTFDDKDARVEREGSFDDSGSHLHNVRDEPKGSFADIDGLPHVVSGDVYTMAGFDRAMVERAMQQASEGCIALLIDTDAVANAEIERVLA